MRAISLLLATLWLAFPLMAQPDEQLVREQREYQLEKEAVLESGIRKLYPPYLFKNLAQLEAGFAKSPDSSTLLKQARWLLPDPNSVVPAHVSRIMGALKFKHDQHATSILYTPDDTRLLTCSRDGTVRLWNLQNGLAAKTWNLGAPLGAMSLSPDGNLLAVAEGYRLYPRIDLSSFPTQEEYAIHLIDLQAGSVVAKLTGIRAPILALGFSADGKQLACGGQPAKGEPLHIWNVAKRELARSFKSIHTINNLAWSNTGTRLFCTSSNKSIDIFDVAKGEQIQSVQERGTLYAMALSPDQEYLAVGGDITEENNYQVIRIYFIKDLRQVAFLGGHQGSIVSLAYHQDGQKLVCGTSRQENTIKVWNVNQKTATAQYLGHTGDVLGIAFSKQGNNLASVSLDGSIRLWLTSEVKAPETIQQSSAPIWVVANRGKRLLMAGADKLARVRDVETSKDLSIFREHASPVTAGCFRPDGAEVATGGGDNTIRLWNPETGQQTASLTGHQGVITALAYSPDSKRLFSSSADKTLRIWDLSEKKLLHTLAQHRSVVTCLAVNMDGSLLASGGADNLIRIWRTQDGSELRSLIGHASAITGLAFSPGGKLLASVSADGMCKVWDPGSRVDAYRTFSGHTGQLMAVAFSPNNKYLATAGADEIIRVWSLVNGNEIRALTGHRDWVTCLTFLQDSDTLLSGSIDGTVKLWAESKAFEPPSLGHESPIRYLAISPLGDVLASGSEDGKIVLWETSTGNILGTLTSHESLIRALAFSSDGKKLLSVDRDQLLKLWDVLHQREIQSLFSKSDGVNRLAFLPGDEGVLASIGSAQICLWKMEGEQINPEPVKTFLGYERHCNSTAFAQGRIALGSTDGNIVHKKIVQFQPDLDELIHCFKVAVHEITMSSDSQRLLAVNQENEFKIWNLTDNKQLSTWKGRSARLTALALNAAGNRALASFDNGEIVLWDDTGKELRSWKFRSLATDLIFSPVAAHAYISTGNGVLFQLDLP